MEKRTGIRQITFQEWTVVILALIPHVCPQILGIFFVQNKNLDCQETEFGGWKGPVVSWLSAYQRNLLVHHHWGRRGKEESGHPYVRERPLVLFSQYCVWKVSGGTGNTDTVPSCGARCSPGSGWKGCGRTNNHRRRNGTLRRLHSQCVPAVRPVYDPFASPAT